MEFVSGVVVAGGVSRRLGQDKRALRLWGERGPTLLEHTLGVLAPLCADLVVVLNDPESWGNLPAKLVTDVYEDAGSLGGIYAGLAAAAQPYSIVVAADMPLLSAELLGGMLTQPRSFQALVPRSSEPGVGRNALDVEPLHAIYSRDCLPVLKATLDAGKRRIVEFLAGVRTEVIEPEEWRGFDPEGQSFRNINTPDDLEAVREAIRRGGRG